MERGKEGRKYGEGREERVRKGGKGEGRKGDKKRKKDFLHVS